MASESATRWVVVARVGDVPPGQVRRVEVEGRVLALVNHEGQFYAFDSLCPHRGGPLDQGEIWQGALECPWHHHRYDLATGANVYPRNVFPDDLPQLQAEMRSAKTYPVKARGPELCVALPER